MLTPLDAPGALILCDPGDEAAWWAAKGLEERLGPVWVVTSEVLVGASSWEHRVGSSGLASAEVVLADGRCVSTARPTGVLNRLTYCPSGRLRAIGGPDGEYAVAEFQAVLLSWLESLPGPMLNRPTPTGLGGHWRSPAAWFLLAHRAGLATDSVGQSERDTELASYLFPPGGVAAGQAGPTPVTVFVVADTVVAPPGVPETTRAACQRLRSLSGDALLSMDLTESRYGGVNWEMISATPTPDLRLGGDALLDALAKALIA